MERELDSTEVTLRDALANVTNISGSSDDVHIRDFITSLKTKTKNYEVANHALIIRRRHIGNTHEADQLVESRLEIVHRDSYQVVKLLNSRLVTLGYERCSSLNLSNTSEHGLVQDNNNKEEDPGDDKGDHSGSLAGADLAESTARRPVMHREQSRQLIDFHDNRSITKQIIDEFEPETMIPTASRPTWRNDFTGVNVDSRSMKPSETQ